MLDIKNPGPAGPGLTPAECELTAAAARWSPLRSRELASVIQLLMIGALRLRAVCRVRIVSRRHDIAVRAGRPPSRLSCGSGLARRRCPGIGGFGVWRGPYRCLGLCHSKRCTQKERKSRDGKNSFHNVTLSDTAATPHGRNLSHELRGLNPMTVARVPEI
jgi:hypothetical protein